MESTAPVVPTDPYTAFKLLSDEEWRAVLLQSVRDTTVRGVELPGFPDEATQVGFTSHKNEEALVEALAFYDIVKRSGAQYGLGWTPQTRLVDFGSGWGRITRTFLKDIAPDNLFGVEINPEVLATCRQLVPRVQFQQCQIGQPFDHADESIDVVVAFSVFSHLSEPNHRYWIQEFHRILRPGGVAVLTTLSRSFLQQCEAALGSAVPNVLDQQVRALIDAGRIKGVEGSFLDFPSDEFFYLPTGGGIAGTEEANYGWAIIPLSYARREWSPLFEICEFADPMGPLDQAVFVLRKPGARSEDEMPSSRWRGARTKMSGLVRRLPGGPRLIAATKAALHELRRDNSSREKDS